MQYNLQSSLVTNLRIKQKNDTFKKPDSWPNIRKNAQNGHIYLLVDDRYPIGFVATVTGGYSINIDGEHYDDYNSQDQFSMADWSDYTDTEGYTINYPTNATKAHIIDIYSQTESNDITAFACARTAASGNEAQGVLWAHFHINNDIDLSKGFAYTEYYNDLLTAVTAKNNLIIASGLDYCFYNAASLKYLPKINYSNVSDMTNFITNAPALENTVLDVSAATTLTKIDICGDSTHFMSGFKGLRISNQAPFNSAITPQINISYTNMDKAALLQLFNDLPTVTDGQSIKIVGCSGTKLISAGSPTIADGIVSNFSNSNYLTSSQQVALGNNFEIVTAFITTDFTSYQAIVAAPQNATSDRFIIQVETTGKLSYWTTNGSDGIIKHAGSNTLAENTKYYLKMICNNGSYTVYISTDNTTFVTDTSFTSEYSLATNHIWIGKSQNNIFFKGSIDLNNTHIKINEQTWLNIDNYLLPDESAIATEKGWTVTVS